MNLLQMEYGVLPVKVLREDNAEYIQSLFDTREQDDVSIFFDCMTGLHCQHLKSDIDRFVRNVAIQVADKNDLRKELVDKWSIKPSLAGKLADILS